MKTLYKIQILLVFSILQMGCKDNFKNDSKMNNELRLKIKITSFGMIGYGNVYACEVLDASNAVFEETKISLTTVTKDHFIESLIPSLPETVVIVFTKGKENEPYRNMPIDGFVDDKNTSWIIKEVTLVK